MTSKETGHTVRPGLIDACRRREPGAFEEVVRVTYRRVYTQALRLVGDRQDAEDVTQEAYLRVYHGLGGFREEAAFETWLYRIVTNAAMSFLRKRGRFGELLIDMEDGPEAGDQLHPRIDQTAVDRDALERALQALPASLRSVVVLKDVYGLSCHEIGDQLGVSEGAVKVRLHRARRRLQVLLSPSEVAGEM